jgi:hypothetical protein
VYCQIGIKRTPNAPVETYIDPKLALFLSREGPWANATARFGILYITTELGEIQTQMALKMPLDAGVNYKGALLIA